MPRIVDEDGHETEMYVCDGFCGRTMVVGTEDEEIRRDSHFYVCEDCAPEYNEDAMFDIAKQERFYV